MLLASRATCNPQAVAFQLRAHGDCELQILIGSAPAVTRAGPRGERAPGPPSPPGDTRGESAACWKLLKAELQSKAEPGLSRALQCTEMCCEHRVLLSTGVTTRLLHIYYTFTTATPPTSTGEFIEIKFPHLYQGRFQCPWP